MAKKVSRTPGGPPPPTALTMPRAKADTLIGSQIEKGIELRKVSEDIREGEVRDGDGMVVPLEAFGPAYTPWDKFNLTMLEQMFTNESLADEYRSAGPNTVLDVGSPVGPPDPLAQFQSSTETLEYQLTTLRSIRERLGLFGEPALSAPPANASAPAQKVARRAAFIVHGHDQAAREAAARVLQQLGIEPIILHEQANQGRTIIEKFERHSDVPFAVVLLTPDDEGRAKGATDLKDRARQNVWFELGFFVGKLGRANVCALHKGPLEIPSDIQGVIYTPMDDGGAWRFALAKELREAGISVDLNRL